MMEAACRRVLKGQCAPPRLPARQPARPCVVLSPLYPEPHHPPSLPTAAATGMFAGSPGCSTEAASPHGVLTDGGRRRGGPRERLTRCWRLMAKEQKDSSRFHPPRRGCPRGAHGRASGGASVHRRRLSPRSSPLCRATPRGCATSRSPTSGRRRGGRSCRRPSGAPSCGRSSSRRRSSAAARRRSPTSSGPRSTRSPRRSRRSAMGSRTWRRTSRKRRCGDGRD